MRYILIWRGKGYHNGLMYAGTPKYGVASWTIFKGSAFRMTLARAKSEARHWAKGLVEIVELR